MLQSENIKNLSELNQSFVDKHKKPEFFLSFIDILKLGKFHAVLSAAKVKGICYVLLIRILITFPFLDQNNVSSFTNSIWSSYFKFGKDAYYRLKNNEKINWRSFLASVTKQLLITLAEQKTGTNGSNTAIKAFIFDDTVIAKTSDKTEGVSKIWNHVIQKYVLGYVLLVMGYYNGGVFIPIDFSFHHEKGKNKKCPYNIKTSHLKNQYRKKRDKNTFGYQRKKELGMSKIKSMIKMLNHAAKNKGFDAQYVLTDSWFTCWETVKAAIYSNLNYIGMFSKVKTNFIYNKKSCNYMHIRELN